MGREGCSVYRCSFILLCLGEGRGGEGEEKEKEGIE